MTYLNKYINFSLLLAAMVFSGGGLIPLAEAGTPPVPIVLSIPIETGSDDAEENTSSGFMSLTSSDLEFTRDGTKTQKIGLRFPLDIPAGATIVSAYVQFTVDETSSELTNLTVHGQAIANALTFTSAGFDITSRTLTAASEAWNALEVWDNVGAAGLDQQTPDLSAIVQEVIDLVSWAQGNYVAFIISGSGKRVAESFTGTAPAVLHVEYTIELPGNLAPDAVDDDLGATPAYTTGQDQVLTVLNGLDDIVERNDNVGFPVAAVTSFGPLNGGETGAGLLGVTAAGGSVTVDANGGFTYTPMAGYLGADSFVYTLTNEAGSDTATVFIDVQAVQAVTTIWVPVLTGSDDAEQRMATGSVSLTSSDLELVRDGVLEQIIGVRFQDVAVPQGATIVNAYIQYTSDEVGTEATNLVIHGQNSVNPATFTTTNSDLSNRPLTASQVFWMPPSWTTNEQSSAIQATPDLKTIAQELVDQAGWVSGNSMVFITSGEGRRVAESFNGTAAPMLHVTYSTEPVPDRAPDAVDEGTNIAAAYVTDLDTELVVPSGLDDVLVNDDLGDPTAVISGFDTESVSLGTVDLNLDGSFTYTPDLGFLGVDSFSYTLTNSEGSDTATVYISVEEVLPVDTVWVSVITSSDDAEENLSSGSVKLTSSDLELIRDGTADQLVGIRFQGINIPQGAVITSAYVQFQVDEIGSETTNILIHGESNANAPTFTTATNNISGRVPTLASVVWADLPEWNAVGVAGVDQQTPDLTTIVQEIVNLGGWSSGSPIVFMIEGTGKRTAESFNGTAGPELHVTFSTEPVVSSPPVAVDDFFTTSMNVPVAGNLLPNDDLGFPLATIFSFVNSVQGGNAVLFPDGSFTYTPPLDFLGPDSFQYTISNGVLPNSSATVTVDIQNVGNEISLWIPVIIGTDDAEEDVSNDKVFTTSSDLEFVLDRAMTQIVGVRFQNVDVPLGVIIEEAYIQYTVDEDTLEQTDLVVVGELNPNPLTFNTSLGNISSRPTTAVSVLWSSVPAWPSRGAAGPDQRTPDLSGIVQELIGQAGWISGNSMVFITSGVGNRVAESFSGTAAPELHLVYSTIPAENLPPVASDVSIIDDNGGDLVVGDTLTGAYTYSDPENNQELDSEFIWYRGGVAIPGATATTYTTVPADGGETLSFEVTPHAIGGATTGATVSSLNTPLVYFELGGVGPAGGIIFFIDGGTPIGLGGIEVAPDMLGPVPWGCHQFAPPVDVIGVTIGVQAQATGTGEPNTAAIVVGCNQEGIAAKLADQYNLNGFNWVLPSAQEGVLLQATGYAGAGTQNFWSSSEKSGSSAYFVQKNTGLIVKRSKNTLYYVHPIRTFGSLVGNVAPEAQNVIIEDVLFDIGAILVGFYDYFDTEGDLEGSTLLQWFRNGVAIVGEIFDVYVADDPLDIGAQLTFGVTAVAQTGSPVGETIVSDIFSPFNTPPTAVIMDITVNGFVPLGGDVAPGELMQGNYTYNDGELDFEGVSTYQWYRNGVVIPLANTEFYATCTSVEDLCEEGDVYHFAVTPIAETGDPMGTTVFSDPLTILPLS